ncbi:MAG: bifunctional oligoribonuclease/PAP phosphatase NrnA [Anaerolineae bacterium]|jgi:bifunctional oligoribonuclease and PAP phosphatase NrnA
MDPNLRNSITELIRGARRILLVTHVAPDGDAIGSLLGLAWLLRAQGKEVTLFCEDGVPEVYAWLPGSAEIVRQAGDLHDLVISLDCSDERRMGAELQGAVTGIPLVNIDHHVTNTSFGTINWVDPSSVSTTQMILELADSLGWHVPQPVAVCLLCGLITDTRSFRTYNVDTAAVQAALRLMEAGASLNELTRRVLDRRPLASVRLWGQAIDRLHLEGDILWTEVTREMRQRWALDENGDSGLANFLSGVREPKVVVVFTERKDGTIDVGMRSVPGYDVAQVAYRLGGGGHPQAAGCTLEGNFVDIRERVLAEVRRALANLSAQDT